MAAGTSDQIKKPNNTADLNQITYQMTGAGRFPPVVIVALDQQESATRGSRIKDLLALTEQHSDVLQTSYGTGREGAVILSNDQGVSLFYFYLSGRAYVAATCYLVSLLGQLQAVENEFKPQLQWRPFEAKTMPRLQKKIDELSDAEFKKLKEFVLRVAEVTKDCSE